MSSNVNALLDKAEDPEKMVDQTLRNLNRDLEKVTEETAGVMADEKKSKRELDEISGNIADLEGYAEKAVKAGNDDDARKFLAEKAKLVKKQEAQQQVYDAAVENSRKMREMHDKLASDIADLESRRDTVKAKVRVAKTREIVNQAQGGLTDSASGIAAFKRMEDKADAMLDAAEAKDELSRSSESASVEDLARKYDSTDSGVDDELAALKAKLGK